MSTATQARAPAGARLVKDLSTEFMLAVSSGGEVICDHPTFLLPERVRLDDLRPTAAKLETTGQVYYRHHQRCRRDPMPDRERQD
jgi:hypothetical protein